MTGVTATYIGYGVSPGVASGPVARVTRIIDLDGSFDTGSVDGTVEDRYALAMAALDHVGATLDERAARATRDAVGVLEALAMMVRDRALHTAVRDALTQSQVSPALAISTAFNAFRTTLEDAGPYFAERATDLDDLRDRAVAHVVNLPMPGIPERDHPFVLVADDLAPADTAVLDPTQVLAIVTERGGPSSHTAILAKSMGIPAVVSTGSAMELQDGDTVLIDGTAGTVQVNPSHAQVDAALQHQRLETERQARVTGPGRTADGVSVKLMVNIGGLRDVALASSVECDGVGLFRTEFLFLERADAPTVEEQVAAYREVFDAFPGRRVTVRTLDAGADKPLGFVTHGDEPNPALGVRGLRTVRSHSHLLDDQLRAISIAAQSSSALVWVMAPMVSVASEMSDFAARARGYGLATNGCMIEVPAAALRARAILDSADFVSIGTNDLAQYTFAADRMLGELGDLLNPWHPALLDLIGLAAEAGHDSGKSVGVCGEAASDPDLALILVGLGIRSLSMAPGTLPAVRAALRAHSLAELEAATATALTADDGAGVRQLARRHLNLDRDGRESAGR